MKVIKDLRIVEDGWILLREVPESGALPPGDIIVPFPFWSERRGALPVRPAGRLGVLLGCEDPLEELVPFLAGIPLLALLFEKFTDGRCYSIARLLRDRHGYRGELRAVGDVLRDQLFFMQRCGINSFQLREDLDLEDALQAFQEVTVKYQASSDGAPPLYRYR
ncbi:MAG: DUF934 domain-containing protein [Gammaproteobacteria bacterium]|nr:DUF934 domain-containing protein [Gammaproteobacteria bacterium]MDD9824199.1 DUF934 domain-containing protein [Gammaproteobacteria bacterium]MDD9863278.1 DUF934 domain-containing protein [Gammaproteobacteria bacterium]